MKKLLSILLVLMLTICAFGMVGCDNTETPDPEHNHTFSKDWTSNETEHWHSANCEHTGETQDKGAHDFVNDVCKICGYKKSTDGEETHHWDTEYTSSNGEHFRVCTDAGCAHVTGVEKCSGGEATCVEFAVCNVCKHPYGELDPNNHDVEHHKAQAPTENEVGWEEYDTCKRAGCAYSTYKEIPATGLTHHWDTEYTSENGQHFYRCTDAGCAHVTGVEKCSGGEATCTELAVCNVCKHPYGELNSNNHDVERHVAQAPTCGDVGWNEYDTCKREGCDYTTYTEIPATGNHTYENGVCDSCGAKEPAPYTRVDENGTESAEGKYILFGMYPQTDVTANATTLGLNAGELPRSNDFNGWMSYDYYENGKNSVKYMWYKDVTVGADKYRAVFYSFYRGKYNTDSGTANNSVQDENGYYYNNVFWFKFEPVKWTIIEENSQTAFLLCNMVIDSQAYQNTATKSGQYDYYNDNVGTPSDTRANNYEYSTIRAWLNDSFYNTAFSDLQKALIMTTLVDNSLDSTGDKTNDNVCNNTSDRVFLISCKDTKTYKDAIGSLTKKSTDYAKAQGCRTDNKDSSSYKGASYWWLRSPNRDSGGSRVQMVREYGAITYDDYNCAGVGIVPALVISLDSGK